MCHYYHILLLHCSLSPGDGLGHNCDEMNVLKVKVYRVCGPMVSSRLSTGSSPPLTWPEPPPLSSLPSHFYQTKIFDAVQKYFITPWCHHHYLSERGMLDGTGIYNVDMNVCQFVPQEMRVCAACWRAELLPRSLVVIIRDKERSGYCLQSFFLSLCALFARVLDIIFWNCTSWCNI